MRIAVNTRFLIKNQLEGIGRFTNEVLRRMVKEHPEHHFIFLFDRPYDEEFLFAKNITPVVLFPPARHPFLFIWWYEWRIPQALKRYKADVFLSMDNFCSIRTKVPTVLVIHDLAYKHFPDQISFLQRKYYQIFTPKFLEKASRIVAVSEYTKKDIRDFFGISPEKIKVACNGTSSLFRPLDPESIAYIRREESTGKPFFLYVGAIHPRKNVHRLIRAYSLFKEKTGSDFQLLIIGRKAWMAGEVAQAYKNSAFKKDIRFTGFVAREKLPAIIAASNALVYVSLFEGFGIPILEAMYCEVPIITSNVSSMPEVAGQAAILVDPLDEEEIAQAMIDLYQSPQLGRSLVHKGKSQRQKFTWNKAAKIVFETLLESVDQPKNHE